MSIEKLNVKPPNEPQTDFLKAIFKKKPGISIAHLIGGRGVGKTTAGVLALVKTAFDLNPGLPHFWTEPTYDDCLKTFLRAWQDMVPASLYKLKLKPMTITTVTGSIIDVVSRESYNSSKEPGRGPNYAAGFFDELAKDPTNKGWVHMIPSIRHPAANQLLAGSTSTPRLGWYRDVVCNGDGAEIYGDSYQNQYIDRVAIDIIKAQYSGKMADQEIYAKWVAMSDLIWEEANLDEYWPNGNLYSHEFDPSLGFVLAMDIGVQGAALIVQSVPIYDDIGWYTGQTVDVAVAEYTHKNADVEAICREVDAMYGEPVKVVVGADINTRSVSNGQTGAMVMQRTIGWNCPIQPVIGVYADKKTQKANASSLLLNGAGHRQFCVSDKLKSHYRTSPECGIRTVLTQDTWAEKPRAGEYMPKDKSERGGAALEDMRDAWLYWAIATHPPMGEERIGQYIRGASN